MQDLVYKLFENRIIRQKTENNKNRFVLYVVMLKAATLALGLMGLCLILSSCKTVDDVSEVQTGSVHPPAERHAAIEEWMDNNPCGHLKIQKPLFNVSGHIPAKVRPGSFVFLYTAHNTTQSGALYVVNHCRAIVRSEIALDGSYTVKGLPAGTYVVSIPNSAFYVAPESPELEKPNQSGYAIEKGFQGKDTTHSITAITIRPVQ